MPYSFPFCNASSGSRSASEASDIPQSDCCASNHAYKYNPDTQNRTFADIILPVIMMLQHPMFPLQSVVALAVAMVQNDFPGLILNHNFPRNHSKLHMQLPIIHMQLHIMLTSKTFDFIPLPFHVSDNRSTAIAHPITMFTSLLFRIKIIAGKSPKLLTYTCQPV